MSRNIAIDGDRLWKYGGLALMLWLLASSVDPLIHNVQDNYGTTLVAILLIINHFAFCYMKQGSLANKAMKVVSGLCTVLIGLYFVCT